MTPISLSDHCKKTPRSISIHPFEREGWALQVSPVTDGGSQRKPTVGTYIRRSSLSDLLFDFCPTWEGNWLVLLFLENIKWYLSSNLLRLSFSETWATHGRYVCLLCEYLSCTSFPRPDILGLVTTRFSFKTPHYGPPAMEFMTTYQLSKDHVQWQWNLATKSDGREKSIVSSYPFSLHMQWVVLRPWANQNSPDNRLEVGIVWSIKLETDGPMAALGKQKSCNYSIAIMTTRSSIHRLPRHNRQMEREICQLR